MPKTLYSRPATTEHAPFYASYIAAVPDGDLTDLLEKGAAEYQALLGGLSESKGDYAYAPGKWSIKEVLGHVIDAERVFSYRALTFARGDAGPLPSFDENGWIGPSGYARRSLADILTEFHATRGATIQLLRYLPPETTTRVGVASGREISVRALAYILVGHPLHHCRVLKERYLT